MLVACQGITVTYTELVYQRLRGSRMVLKCLLFTCMLLANTLAEAQEYWAVWFYASTADSFDAPPRTFHQLEKAEAIKSGSYFAVDRDMHGLPLEVVQMLNGRINYRYRNYYDTTGKPLVRFMEFQSGTGMQLISEVVWSYNDAGKLLSSAYYTYPTAGLDQGPRELKYLKTYTGSNYLIYERPVREDPALTAVIRRLDAMQSRLKELEKLESRNLLQKILGIGR